MLSTKEIMKYIQDTKNTKEKSAINIVRQIVLTVTVAALVLIVIPVRASETDDSIVSSARNSYVFQTYLKGDDIKIESKDGAVTLTGIVPEELHMSLAKETVAALPGVVSVDIRLKIKDTLSTANSDVWLKEKVKSTLLFHRNVNATEIEVLAKDGIVTLRGETTSAAQKKLATEYAKDVEGVKKVKNEMTVLTPATKPGKKTIGEKVDAISESIDDASITALVKTTLLFHRSTSALNTTVVTKKGVVELRGKTRTVAEKSQATKLVSDVYGVKKVVNKMIAKYKRH